MSRKYNWIENKAQSLGFKLGHRDIERIMKYMEDDGSINTDKISYGLGEKIYENISPNSRKIVHFFISTKSCYYELFVEITSLIIIGYLLFKKFLINDIYRIFV